MHTPYKQAHLVTTETGKVVLAVVEGEDPRHGEQLAHDAVQEKFDGKVWDSCAFPTTDDLELGVFEFENNEYRRTETPSPR